MASEMGGRSIALDLGCGANPKNPFSAEILYGIDIRDDISKNIIRADLVLEPIPFPDNAFDYVTAFDFIEHVPRIIYTPSRRNPFIEVMNEIWRVLKPGGKFLSITPAYPHHAAFRDPTHVNIITEETFPMYFDSVRRWAAMYGFRGAFEIEGQSWNGPHLHTLMRKMEQ